MTPNKKFRGGCLCCQGTEDALPLDTVLYQGFGGFHVERDGEIIYYPACNTDWDDFKTLAFFERMARRNAKAIWRVVLSNPLRGAVWERRRGKWHLIETNQGFA